ncbi:carboxylic ester hydrolase-29 [Coleophoma cylindrospora]|uniref:Carboxylic ester hydrolase n=1 Tax=Coleophoma cylindrospora TaxID=1849047 RepID=A0A3D8R5Q8_9HELO|nr:carboxylic ester hydrolase-29 [Coleophoma cylindrospora]
MTAGSMVALTAAVALWQQNATLDDVCTAAYVKSALPSSSTYPGIVVNPASVLANPVTNANVSGENFFPDATFDYCNVTFAYTHTGRNDTVNVRYWLPAPASFKNRYLSTGGGGYAINSGYGDLPGGIIYGATAGATDAGFGNFSTNLDAVNLIANNTVDWQRIHMFGYEAIHELSVLGKEFTRSFFAMNTTKLYSYYQGCSEGGRDGWSQVQRFADEWDGAITGAPAMRFAFQQTQHLYSNIVEQTLDYYPSPCELEKITNLTIAACDPMDGKTDGVVSRSDLCKLNFNLNSTVGQTYYCAATSASSGMGSGSPFGASAATPAQNGTITAQGVAVAQTIIDGLKDSSGKQVYLSYQPGAVSFDDAKTAFNNVSNKWELSVNSFGAEFIARFINDQELTTLPNLNNVTYDTLKGWMYQGWQKYADTLHTTWPDLTAFQAAGGKVLHFHGESDNSIPTASSVHYHESVRNVMYPNMSFNESSAAMSDWYQLYLVPGAAHCAVNTNQPNGPFPQTNLAVMIDWVEKGVKPTTLNATVLQGSNKGQNEQICAWPLRPMWSDNGTTMNCEYDQASINTWMYTFDAFKMPVY